MRETRVANRYAKALFDLADEMNLIDQIHMDMELLLTVCKQNRDFMLMLKSPVIHDKKKKAIFQEIFGKKMHELTLRFIILITKNRREIILDIIAEQFVRIYQKFMNILPTTLTTAIKLDKETRDRIVSLAEKGIDANIKLTEEVDQEIIGGFVLEFEDKQYDASVLRKIKNLQKEFDVNLYIKGF